MHLLVFSCGAFGYVATKWVNTYFFPPHTSRWSTIPEAAAEEDDEHLACGEAHESADTVVASSGAAKVVGAIASAPVDVQGSEPPSICDLARVPTVAAPKVCDTVTCNRQVSLSDAADNIEVSAPASCDAKEQAPSANEQKPMSDRVVRLLAKKAERKARKAHQREVEEQAASIEPAQKEQNCQMVQEPPSLPERSKGEKATELTKQVQIELIPEHIEDTAEVQPQKSGAAMSRKSTMAAAVSELSTTDEFSSWDAIETDSSWEGDDMEEVVDERHSISEQSAASPSADPRRYSQDSGVATSAWAPPPPEHQEWAFQSSWSGRQQESWIEDDGWMLSFDEILRRRAASAEPTAEHAVPAAGEQTLVGYQQPYVAAPEGNMLLVPEAPMMQLYPHAVGHCGQACGGAGMGNEAWDAFWGVSAW